MIFECYKSEVTFYFKLGQMNKTQKSKIIKKLLLLDQ